MNSFNAPKAPEKYSDVGRLVERDLSHSNAPAGSFNNGWRAPIIPLTTEKSKVIDSFPPEMYANGNINICFFEHIPGVFERMQPMLNKVYSARPHYRRDKLKAKLYYIITLDNGNPLIVYPGEFYWVKESQAA